MPPCVSFSSCSYSLASSFTLPAAVGCPPSVARDSEADALYSSAFFFVSFTSG
jgi:hypothetical protein